MSEDKHPHLIGKKCSWQWRPDSAVQVGTYEGRGFVRDPIGYTWEPPIIFKHEEYRREIGEWPEQVVTEAQRLFVTLPNAESRMNSIMGRPGVRDGRYAFHSTRSTIYHDDEAQRRQWEEFDLELGLPKFQSLDERFWFRMLLGVPSNHKEWAMNKLLACRL